MFYFNHSERGMTGIEKPPVLPNHCTFQLDLNKRLLNAANEGSLTKVRALLTEGASVNFCDADGKFNSLVTNDTIKQGTPGLGKSENRRHECFEFRVSFRVSPSCDS